MFRTSTPSWSRKQLNNRTHPTTGALPSGSALFLSVCRGRGVFYAQKIAIFGVLALMLAGACFGISQSIEDESAWVNTYYEDYTAAPEKFTVVDATVTDHFKGNTD